VRDGLGGLWRVGGPVGPVHVPAPVLRKPQRPQCQGRFNSARLPELFSPLHPLVELLDACLYGPRTDRPAPPTVFRVIHVIPVPFEIPRVVRDYSTGMFGGVFGLRRAQTIALFLEPDDHGFGMPFPQAVNQLGAEDPARFAL